MKLLHIIASPRGENSRTLEISNEFLSTLKQKHSNIEIDELDLYQEELPEVYDGAVSAKYQLVSGMNLDEDSQSAWNNVSLHSQRFLAADMYLISCPMWNFSIPYKLKHYLDLIVQPGHLFTFTESGVEGLAKGKSLYCVSTSGSDYSEGSPMESLDFLKPYLRTIFGFVGIHNIEFIHAQPLDYSPDIAKSKVKEAQELAITLANAIA